MPITVANSKIIIIILYGSNFCNFEKCLSNSEIAKKSKNPFKKCAYTEGLVSKFLILSLLYT